MFRQVQPGADIRLEFSFVADGSTVQVSNAAFDVYDPYGNLVATGNLQYSGGVYITYYSVNTSTLGSYMAVGRGEFNYENVLATSRVHFDVVAAPTIELVTVDEVKDYLQISDYNEDSLLNGLILAASKAILEYTQARIGNNTVSEEYNLVGANQYELRYFPVNSLDSISIDDVDLVEDTDFYFDASTGIIKFFNTTTGYLKCSYSYGHSQIPLPMRLACLKFVTTLYNLRESEGFSSRRLLSNVENYLRDTKMDIFFEVRSLLAPYRRKLA